MGVSGCVSGTESLAVDVSPEGWSSPVQMRYSNRDTLAAKELHLALRHAPVLEETSGEFAVRIASPLGNIACDTLAVSRLPLAGGNELGESQAAPQQVHFSELGDYLLTVTPLQETTGVWSVGVELTVKNYGKR
jgi:hypothetical protein